MKLNKFLFFLLFISGQVSADWAVFGIAYNCDTVLNKFTVLPTARTSDPTYDIVAPENFTQAPKGKRQSVSCKLNNKNINMQVSVYGPQSKGVGKGAGVVFIHHLLVNGKDLLNRYRNFNWQVHHERVLTEITLKEVDGKITSKFCMTDGWGWNSQYENKVCKTNPAFKRDYPW